MNSEAFDDEFRQEDVENSTKNITLISLFKKIQEDVKLKLFSTY